jgi:prepilin-type N-terminal cleavage/methylation domain-containing protein
MKNRLFLRRPRRAFTLIELLVVISIIAILAAMLLPVLGRVKGSAQKTKAKLEAGQIATAIRSYDSDYSRFPVSSNALSIATAAGEDLTYGTDVLSTNGGPSPVSLPSMYGSYKPNNAEVMAVLMDLEYYPNGIATINKDHVKNPQKAKYLSATMVADTISSGIGKDGVYRDPWGTPYIITIDLNYDDKARDVFYRGHLVSQENGASGYYGLINAHTPPTPPDGNSDYFECIDKIMVWSLGPDRRAEWGQKANQGANKDNILSWKSN